MVKAKEGDIVALRLCLERIVPPRRDRPVHLYDLVKDFEPVALLTIAPIWMLCKSALPADNIKELITWLKANGAASAAAVGMGSASLQKHTGTRFAFVPYRGAAPANQDLIAGQILEDLKNRGLLTTDYMLVDTASRPGMSGAPVIRRSWTNQHG